MVRLEDGNDLILVLMGGVDKPDLNFVPGGFEPWGNFYSVFVLKWKLIKSKLKIRCKWLTACVGDKSG